MSFLVNKKQILSILAENLKNKQPQVMDTSSIAERLNMTLKEACQLIRVMNSKGLVESDPDGQRALITREGLMTVEGNLYRKAA